MYALFRSMWKTAASDTDDLETHQVEDCTIQHGGADFHYNFLEFWIVMKGKGTARVTEVMIEEL